MAAVHDRQHQHPVVLALLEGGDRGYRAGARVCLVQLDGSVMLFKSRDGAERFCVLHGLRPVTCRELRRLRAATLRRN